MTEVATLSTKGQIVIPKTIRKKLNISDGTQFVIFCDEKNILLKPIEQPDIAEFRNVMQQAQDWASEQGMTESDIADAVKAVRRDNR